MNRSEMRSLVIDHTGRSDKVTLINNMINNAVRKVSSEHLWSDLLTSGIATFSVGSNVLALASNLRRLLEVRVMDGFRSYQIELRPKKWVLERYPDITVWTNTWPYIGYLQGTTLYVVPAPNQAYQCEYSYYKVHPDLVNETDEMEIRNVDDAVIAWATYRTFKSLQMHEEATQWLADYGNLLKDAKMLDRDSAVQLKGTPRHDWRGRYIPGDFHLDPFVKDTF